VNPARLEQYIDDGSKFLYLTENNFYIRKRNGKIVPFDQERITQAIQKAMESTGTGDRSHAVECSNEVCRRILRAHHERSIPAVEEIQDLVENVLIDKDFVSTARSYILYREQHSRLRETRSLLLDIKNTMDGYLKQSDWRVRENSNVNYSLGGLILHNSGTVTANYWLNHIYSREIATAHRTGSFHLHDLSMFSGYCAGWSLRQLIEEGLGGVPNKISSEPARHLNTLVNQMVNFLGVLQNEWAGAQAFSSFDTYLAPFVRKDSLTYHEVKQAVQSFIFGVNTPSRWGSQAPFTNITLDWVVPEDLRDEHAIIGGKPIDQKYKDYQEEMNMINRAFLEVMMEGDADGRGFPYPIPTYNITPDFDWDSDNAKLLFKMTAKYGTPYFQNFVNSDLKPGDVRSMCCRLQLDKRELRKKGGGLFGAAELTGSIGVVTINLPRIGYLSRSRGEFFIRLTRIMELAKKSLEIKREVATRLMNEGLFPYSKRYLKTWDSHFSTIGIVGMNECSQNFLGKDLSHDDGREFAVEVLDFMREQLVRFQSETGNLYNLEATPAESTSFRLAKIDKKRYPGIKISGDADPYYTNSTQLPVDYTSDIFEALDLQEELQIKYTGGTVFHAFLGERMDETESCKKLVQRIMAGYRIPYLTISPTFSVCTEHGYLRGEHENCPRCGGETEVYARIVGYYRPVRNWNKGKREEYRHRTTFAVEQVSASGGNGTPGFDEPGLSAFDPGGKMPGRGGLSEFPRFNNGSPDNGDSGGKGPKPGEVSEISKDERHQDVTLKLFSVPSCSKCEEVKTRLSELGLEFENFNLREAGERRIFNRYYPHIRKSIERADDGSLPLPIMFWIGSEGGIDAWADGKEKIFAELDSSTESAVAEMS